MRGQLRLLRQVSPNANVVDGGEGFFGSLFTEIVAVKFFVVIVAPVSLAPIRVRRPRVRAPLKTRACLIMFSVGD
jgi:hypothetical protein